MKDNKTAIGWTLVDLKEISPSICMHRILLKNDSKLVRKPQCQLNSVEGGCYERNSDVVESRDHLSISDSQWVSLVYVVPKKTDFTLVHNGKNERIPMRV